MRGWNAPQHAIGYAVREVQRRALRRRSAAYVIIFDGSEVGKVELEEAGGLDSAFPVAQVKVLVTLFGRDW